ncbi:hypothetical protein D6789_01240 [Candidatus Woesearchaeota archaeon]|nr:MAG: hypothetical protein D6789_01240 [Candidatus Woesearchaeota archaeon]
MLPFDARRIAWEELLHLTGLPSRLYVPRGLREEDLVLLEERFLRAPNSLPWGSMTVTRQEEEYAPAATNTHIYKQFRARGDC